MTTLRASYERLGAHLTETGVDFSVWAPNAKKVSVLGHEMDINSASGVWNCHVPGIQAGTRYQFDLTTCDGKQVWKSDPYAFQTEMRPHCASIVSDWRPFDWTDDDWMKSRGRLDTPINIYEVHLGSWIKGDPFLNYRTLAQKLANYCLEMNYTHVELLPIMEHPLDESWGYQVTGFYSVTSRYGTLDDFKWMVNYLHKKGLGIILDWVPAHFPNDEHALAHFDGTALYEHLDPRQGFHPEWTTHIFNYGRQEVCEFLLGSALYWLRETHVDGLRVDAVASMLYLDFGRKPGQWIPNKEGGRENLEAITFLKQLNSTVKKLFPTALMIAEESSIYPGVTRSVEEGGLGFTMKWNMGWMNDTLRYMETGKGDPSYTYSYSFSEQFLLPLSHDEVVHCKKSLKGKVGDRLPFYFSWMLCHPGKKLLFMGGEIAQQGEWDCKGELDWVKTDKNVHTFLQNLNSIYQTTPALWERDFDEQAFTWLEKENSFLSYLREGNEQTIWCLHNFENTNHSPIVVPEGTLKPILGTSYVLEPYTTAIFEVIS